MALSGSIKAIDGESVHRIHAGQVVLELQAAIKELVENSLDAGATSIDVRIKDYGLESVEVSDNGSGIGQSDWESIGLKHHTSKLPSLSLLPLVTTFGFRGEALSSLRALCESVVVTTSTKETAPMGSILRFGRDGQILDSSGRVARQRGTTVILNGLFVPLPVRRKEFERTAKREFAKALSLLTGYALVPSTASTSDGRTGVRLKVESIGGGKNGKRNTVLITDGKGSLRSSVTSVWGPKALEGVLDLELDLEVDVDKIMARREGIQESPQIVHVSGLISSASWGQGRSSSDRQFFYINGRPCNMSKAAKTINETYKSFNTHQFPLAILDFLIPPESVDINVSPDKRTIMIHSETNLLEALRMGLEAFWQPSRSSFALGVPSAQGSSTQVKLTQRLVGGEKDVVEAVGVFGVNEDIDDEEDGVEEGVQDGHGTEGEDELLSEDDDNVGYSAPASNQTQTTRKSNSFLHIQSPQASRTRSLPTFVTTSVSKPIPAPARAIQQTLDTKGASWNPERRVASRRAPQVQVPNTHTVSGRAARKGLRERLAVYASQTGDPKGVMDDEDEDEEEGEEADLRDENEESEKAESEEAEVDELEEVDVDQPAEEGSGAGGGVMEVDSARTDHDGPVMDEGENLPQAGNGHTASSMTAPASRPRMAPEVENKTIDESDDEPITSCLDSGLPQVGIASSSSSSSYRDETRTAASLGESTLSFDLARLRVRYHSKKLHSSTGTTSTPVSRKDAFSVLAEGGMTSAAGIGNRDMAAAEDALSRVISKPDFERMEVIGQFNKGFIIARLRSQQHPSETDISMRENRRVGSDDLFIIDQHASDEKYNFETLQRTTVIKAQQLIKPRALQLTSGDEIVAMENLQVLKTNGFEVKIDEDKPPGRGERISLLAMPVSKDTTFDFKDLEQLLHLLSDGARPAGQMVRCSKARTMFASRACRKSVMIGKSLTKSQMVQLLRNMGTIDQPWNCPHGRPTMRHLTKIEPFSEGSSSSRDRINWTEWK